MKTIKSLTEEELAELPKLPEEWKWARLGEIHILKSEKHTGSGESLFYVGLEHIKKDRGTLTEFVKIDVINTVKNSFKVGDLLYGKLRPYLNKVYLANEDGVCSTDILVFESNPSLNLNYSKYFFLSYKFVNDMTHNSSGVNLPRVSTKYLLEYPFPLCPLPEQRAIVSKIELLFSELDNGIANLKLAQEQLKVYRQAVLDKTTKTEMFAPINTIIDELGQGWSPKCHNEPSINSEEWGVIKTTAIQAGYFNEKENKKLPADLEPRVKHELKAGDILITRAGPRVRVGVCCLIKKVRPRLINCDKAYRIRLKGDLISPQFFEYILSSPKYARMMENLKTGISDSGVNLTQNRFLDLEIPLPPLTEQYAIVQEIETRLSVCDKVEQDIEENLIRAEALRQSILKKAFEGKLLNEKELVEVRMAEDWEPAEVLLERIRAEKTRK